MQSCCLCSLLFEKVGHSCEENHLPQLPRLECASRQSYPISKTVTPDSTGSHDRGEHCTGEEGCSLPSKAAGRLGAVGVGGKPA